MKKSVVKREKNRDKRIKSKTQHKRKRHNTKKYQRAVSPSVVVVGRVYAEWCGHCIAMKPEWTQLETHFESQQERYPNAKTKYEVVSISSDELSTKKPQVEQMYLSNTGNKIDVKGYPTIFKIVDGKIEYYNGERRYSPMLRWFLAKPSQSRKHFPKVTI
jgi:thiol-disulfide isomerase/thioredoxin